MQPCKMVKLGCHYVFWLTALLNRLFCALSVLSLFPHCNYSQLPSYLSTVLAPSSLPFLRPSSATHPAHHCSLAPQTISQINMHPSAFRQIPTGQTHPYKKNGITLQALSFYRAHFLKTGLQTKVCDSGTGGLW